MQTEVFHEWYKREHRKQKPKIRAYSFDYKCYLNFLNAIYKGENAFFWGVIFKKWIESLN